MSFVPSEVFATRLTVAESIADICRDRFDLPGRP